MASSSRSSSSGMNNVAGQRRLCGHKLPAILNTSHTHKNPERRYIHCRYRFTATDCGFWAWYDEELNPYYKECFMRLYAERDNALRNQALKNGRPDYALEEDTNNAEEVAAMDLDQLSISKSMNSTVKKLEFQIRMLYVAFAFVLLMFVVYKN